LMNFGPSGVEVKRKYRKPQQPWQRDMIYWILQV
jgi:hypothetical protein